MIGSAVCHVRCEDNDRNIHPLHLFQVADTDGAILADMAQDLYGKDILALAKTQPGKMKQRKRVTDCNGCPNPGKIFVIN
jgi:hypothetical protein